MNSTQRRMGYFRRRVCFALMLGIVGSAGSWLLWPVAARGQDSNAQPDNHTTIVAADAPQDSGTDSAESTASPTPKNPKDYDLWVLLPAAIAILLAIFTRQVVPALVVGILAGAYMMVPCLEAGTVYTDSNVIIGGFRLACEKYLIGAVLDPGYGYAHLKIMFFTLMIGFMVGVIGRNGGTAGLVKLVAGDTDSPRRGALTAWFAGLVVFFDDYANTMIVGPTMRSVFDRLKISRAKLAYIVDSTAAPVASLALIGTWVGAEMGYIGEGLDQLGDARPEFLAGVEPMTAFVHSLAYRFYPILALVLVFWVSLTGRDFGPMKRAQTLALAGEEERPYEVAPRTDEEEPTPRWWLGLVPVLVLIGVTVGVLVGTGLAATGEASSAADGTAWWQRASDILSDADSFIAIFYGAVLAAISAVVLTLLTRACNTKDAVDAGLDGMARMFPAIVILILAWALSQVEQDLMLGAIVSDHLQAAEFPAEWMPLAIFLAAAGISFATGTSWATMGILCPITVTITAGLAAELPADEALELFYAAVGSVLAGSIFGDHCSPISDTTVLSSVAAGCRHESHVWTQMPYALVTAVVAMGVGEILCGVYDQPWYYGWGAGTVILLLVVLIVGRRPKPLPPPTLPSALSTWPSPRTSDDG
ncbi:MAG: Na+/H+ antiporter NhaC family protein [Planctomycetes bacterium]|nr:Na+/H+ antiporter NhaC family protein [Planctomycetota bacterium]